MFKFVLTACVRVDGLVGSQKGWQNPKPQGPKTKGNKKGKTKERGASKEDTHSHKRTRLESRRLRASEERNSKQTKQEREKEKEREHQTERKKERQLRERESQTERKKERDTIHTHTHNFFSYFFLFAWTLRGVECSSSEGEWSVVPGRQHLFVSRCSKGCHSLFFLSCCSSSSSWIELSLVPSFNICNSSSSCQTSDSKENSLSRIKQSVNQSMQQQQQRQLVVAEATACEEFQELRNGATNSAQAAPSAAALPLSTKLFRRWSSFSSSSTHLQQLLQRSPGLLLLRRFLLDSLCSWSSWGSGDEPSR